MVEGKKRGLTAWERWELAALQAPEPKEEKPPMTTVAPLPGGAREAIWRAAHWQRWLPDSFDEPPPTPTPLPAGEVIVEDFELSDEVLLPAVEETGPEVGGEVASDVGGEEAAEVVEEQSEGAAGDEGPEEPSIALEPETQPEPEPEPPTDVEAELPTAEQIEAIHDQAFEEGYTLGYAVGREAGEAAGHQEGYAAGEAQGLAAAQARIDEQVAALSDEAAKVQTLLGRLEEQFSHLERGVADELLALAVELARQVLRGELTARPEVLLGVVREALAQLPHQHAVVWLHPQDATLLRSHLGEQLHHAGHRLQEDASLERGDCLIEAGGSQLDATVATRWRRVLDNLGLEAAWRTPEEEASVEGRA